MRDGFGHGPPAERGLQRIYADGGSRLHPGTDLLHRRVVGPSVGRCGLGHDQPPERLGQHPRPVQILGQLRRAARRGDHLHPRRTGTDDPHDAGGERPGPDARREPHRAVQQSVESPHRAGEQPQGELQTDPGFDRLFGHSRRGRRRNTRARPGVDRESGDRHRCRHVQHIGEHLAAQASGRDHADLHRCQREETHRHADRHAIDRKGVYDLLARPHAKPRPSRAR